MLRAVRVRAVGPAAAGSRASGGQRHVHVNSAAAAAAAAAAAVYRRFGHEQAAVNPLAAPAPSPNAPLLRAAASALDAASAAALAAAYTGAVGAEFEHLESPAERAWWAARLEGDAGAGVPPLAATPASPAAARNALALLLRAEAWEAFLAKKFPTLKRYGGEGSEGALVAVEAVTAAAAAAGAGDVVVGEAHRGRLAYLVAALNYPPRKLLWKISGEDDFPAGVDGLDDVSSHAHTSVARAFPGGGAARVSLLPNPSHLEAVNPVAAGKVRAKRDRARLAPTAGAGPLCLLVHGDAAVAGQGVVAECYAMSRLPGFAVGGTAHVIVNNQVGFTAEGDAAGRSSRYASDMAKSVGAPVLHVNGEDVPALLAAARAAVDYRTAFGRDVVLDVIGWRRNGHNEVDEPSFTNPALYAAIRPREGLPALYARALVAAGVTAADDVARTRARLAEVLEQELAASRAFSRAGGSLGAPAGADAARGGVVADGSAFAGAWAGFAPARAIDLAAPPPATGVAVETLRRVAAASVAAPAGFAVHDRLVRGHVRPREAAAAAAPSAPGVDWATAEAMALGSLLLEGVSVRLCGQDAERGTFSHRHAVLVDQATGARHTPLAALSAPARGGAGSGGGGSAFYPVSSLLSEEAVLGFEHGYSLDSPHALVLWEAQFGDFANSAQVVVDTFVASAESKWLRASSLTLLLPHGHDGAGPEHSSARVERFLQLVNSPAWARGHAPCDAPGGKAAREAVNLRVLQPTTAANYFHALRRQQAGAHRKPAVVLTPKQLLRAPGAQSPLDDMAPGTAFQRVLDDVWPPGADAAAAGAAGGAGQPFAFDARAPADAARVTRAVLVTGKAYYELGRRRAAVAAAGGRAGARAAATALVRIEELAPWPAPALDAALARFPNLRELEWAQEEPANAGAWTWAEAHLACAPPGGAAARALAAGAGAGAAGGARGPRLHARPALAAPAVGLSKRHAEQQAAWLESVFPAE